MNVYSGCDKFEVHELINVGKSHDMYHHCSMSCYMTLLTTSYALYFLSALNTLCILLDFLGEGKTVDVEIYCIPINCQVCSMTLKNR